MIALLLFFSLSSSSLREQSRRRSLSRASFLSLFRREKRKYRVELLTVRRTGAVMRCVFCEWCCVFVRELKVGRGMRGGKRRKPRGAEIKRERADEEEEEKGAAFFSFSLRLDMIGASARSRARALAL